MKPKALRPQHPLRMPPAPAPIDNLCLKGPFRLGILALEVGERDVQRLVSEADSDGVHGPQRGLTSGLPTSRELAALVSTRIRLTQIC